MRDFHVPFKPEELLKEHSDGRLWAENLPDVDDWSPQQTGKELDKLVGRVLKSGGRDIAEDASFSLLFALLQGWVRLEDNLQPRVSDLLADAARRIGAEVAKRQKAAADKKQGKAGNDPAMQEIKTASKVAVFFLGWVAEKLLKQPGADLMGRGRGKGRGRGGGGNPDKEAAIEEAKEAQKALEKQRCTVLIELSGLISNGAMPWLWMSEPEAWKQVARRVADAGFEVLDAQEVMKHRETKQLCLRCIAAPLLQQGHQHSELLMGAVSKLMHGLRSGENSSTFVADAMLQAHTTPLPRLFLVELTQRCNGAELVSQGAFQRAIAQFLVALTERLPHMVLANIAVLLPLLDVDCYPLRSAIVESIGTLLASQGRKLPSGAHCEAPKQQEEGEQAEGEEAEQQIVAANAGGPADIIGADQRFHIATATKKDLLDTLMTRSLDKSVWVRFRALQMLTSLAAITKVVALPREQWAHVLQIATRRMQDMASSTRKASMQLVRTLIEFHPYGPALQGSGNERHKAEQLLKEVSGRLNKLQAEEIADAEAEAKGRGIQNDDGENVKDEVKKEGEDEDESQPAKRTRIKGKTVTEQTVDVDLKEVMAEEDDGEDDPNDKRQERARKREALKRMRDCYSQRLQFVELIDAAEARLRALLVSRTTTDVTEAISVVVELRLKNVPAATRAFDQVLGLVWSRQASIKDAAVEAFKRMHLEEDNAATAVQSLLEMYQRGCEGGTWTYTHLASVQELIQQSAEKEYIDVKSFVPVLLTALEGPLCPYVLRTLAAFTSGATSEVVTKALPRIAALLGRGGPALAGSTGEQLERLRLTCQLLQGLQASSKAKLDEEAWGHLWALTQNAIEISVECFARKDVPPQWFAAVQAAMDLSFDLSLGPLANGAMQCCPDKLWEQILGRMMHSVLKQEGAADPNAMPICDDPNATPGDAPEGDAAPAAPSNINSAQVSCIVFLSGHLALRMLIYLEALHSALKRKRITDEDRRMAEQREKKAQKPKAKGKKGAKEDEKEDDEEGQATSMGMAGQEERENEAFAELAEHGLLYGRHSLLDRCKPLLLGCLTSPALRGDAVLRRLGAIGLCKFMTISKKFCEENLQLLFSILFPKNKAAAVLESVGGETQADLIAGSSIALLEDMTLRQSLLVAVGDLLFRHPNVVEPWTGRLYATLGAPAGQGSEGQRAIELRLTALLVLTHLVLNDMMKPRAILLVRALWLTACTHATTARVARILFQELSKRSTNVVYNLLPEIIARLPEHSGTSGQVEGGAEERVKYVMQFIEKEKHIEGMIEKFIVRLEQSANLTGTNATQGEDEEGDASPARAQETVSCLSHALGSMNYTDRCILRLHDAVIVRKALNTAISYHEVTRECLLSIVERARRPKVGKEKGAEAAPAPEPDTGAPADGAPAKGGVSAAAAAALDAIEQMINKLAKGQEEDAMDADPNAPVQVKEDEKPEVKEIKAEKKDEDDLKEEVQLPVKSGGGKGRNAGKGAKRRAEPVEEEEPDEEEAPKKGKGRGRGRGAGRGGRGGAADAKAATKKRRTRAADDDDADE